MTQLMHLDPSELGTRAYWDATYTTEYANFQSNAADEGTIWFNDAGAEDRMLAFLEDLAEDGVLNKGEEMGSEEAINDGETGHERRKQKPTRFLDLGTGNGHLLFALREDGWLGEMLGVDYSSQSVQLAKQILATKADLLRISFHEFDVLSREPGEWLQEGFDIVFDKGTFDAICLSQETDAQGRRICEGYREKVVPLMKKGGRFLITSCNWTAEELRKWFEVDDGELVYEEKVEYPSFTFGGKTGTSVCTLCFKRR